jgi:hypothetical protein
MNTELGMEGTLVDSTEDKVKKEQIRSNIVSKLAELGIDNCPEEIIDRLLIIGEHSGFNIDSEMVCEAFGNVLSVFETKKLVGTHLTSEQKGEGLLAAFLHDIGKSGPSLASLECRLSVIKLFSVKINKIDISKYIHVGDALKDFFPDDYDKMVDNLSEAGVTPDMTMHNFWHKHSWWTHDILLKYPDVISGRADLIASSHHVSDGENPCGVSEDEVPQESKVIRALEHYVDFLEERILMLIDKYQAALTREDGSTHESAIAYLKAIFNKYEKGSVTDSIIETIDELGKSDSLFPKTKSKYHKNTV